MVETELRQKRVDGSDLDAGATTSIPQLRGRDVVVSIWNQERQGRKPIQDLRPRPWAREPLQKLLQDETRRENRLAGLEGTNQLAHFLSRRGRIASQRERPHTRIDEQVQARERSDL